MLGNLLTEAQEDKVIMQLAEGQKEFSEDDAWKVLVWANKAMLDKGLIEMVLDGKLTLVIKNGEVYFCNPTS